MALPLLPVEEIPSTFSQMKTQVNTDPLKCLVEYIESTWITSTMWPPSCWSVYLQAVRTNNDVEGWHNSLNRRAHGKSQIPFYLLIELLHQEARLTSLQVRLVSEKKLKRIQRKQYRTMQGKIFNLWSEYQNGEKSAYELLKAFKYMSGPRK